MAVSRGGVEQSPAYTARQIAALRKREKLSEERFAYAIGVNVKAVRAWERGIHRPSRQSLKLLNLLDRKGLDGIE
ncbi:MAG: helix-turn-helix domain-containing protein [bacterium]